MTDYWVIQEQTDFRAVDENALLGGRGDDRLDGRVGIDEIDGGQHHDIAYESIDNYNILAPIHVEEQIIV